MFNNTAQAVKQGAKDFTVGFDSRQRSYNHIQNVCEVTQPLSSVSWEINPREEKCLVLKSNHSSTYSMPIMLNLFNPGFYSTNHQVHIKKLYVLPTQNIAYFLYVYYNKG